MKFSFHFPPDGQIREMLRVHFSIILAGVFHAVNIPSAAVVQTVKGHLLYEALCLTCKYPLYLVITKENNTLTGFVVEILVQSCLSVCCTGGLHKSINYSLIKIF